MKEMDNNTQIILEEVKNLISDSIKKSAIINSDYKNFHCDILKQYFEAKNIEINYENKCVDLQLPISNNNYTDITFECLDLKGFLQACIKTDSKSLTYYKNLLSQYRVESAA